MKRLLLILFFLPSCLLAQSNASDFLGANATIMRISTSDAQYSLVGRDLVKKVAGLFKKEIATTSPTEIDWKTVVLTTNKNDVAGLKKIVDLVHRESTFLGHEIKLRNEVQEMIKKEAAIKGASVVLIESDSFSYFPVNNVKITGIAYGKK